MTILALGLSQLATAAAAAEPRPEACAPLASRLTAAAAIVLAVRRLRHRYSSGRRLRAARRDILTLRDRIAAAAPIARSRRVQRRAEVAEGMRRREVKLPRRSAAGRRTPRNQSVYACRCGRVKLPPPVATARPPARPEPASRLLTHRRHRRRRRRTRAPS
jgi:hypothetical protein